MSLLVVYLLTALVFSFFCSISEAVLLSVRPTYIAALEHKKVAGAAALRVLKSAPDRPLAAILSLNTVAHTVGAVGVGAQAAIVFGSDYVGLASAILTLLILVFSEIIPKTLGATYWHRLAPFFGTVLIWLTRLLLPLVWLSERITRLVSPTATGAYNFSRAEFQAMAELGAREGDIDEKELKIVRNVLRLRALCVRHIMTPRSVVFMVPVTMTAGAFFESHADCPFSRIAVFHDDPDDIRGYVLKNDLLIARAEGQTARPLSEFLRPFLVLPDSQTVSEVFDQLARARSHIALVVDEYGSVQGLVTLEDVVETLIGLEITDELDTVEDMQKLARRRWRERVSALGIDADGLKAEAEEGPEGSSKPV